MTEELKQAAQQALEACPFCGSEAKLNTITDDPESANYQGNYIACEACGSSTQLMFSAGEDCRPVLAQLWNTRALTQRPAAQEVGVLERCAQWCDEQARSDWWGRKASDMVRAFASLPAQRPAAQAGEVPCVTLGSAIEAIEHVSAHNGPGREAEAIAKLRHIRQPAAQAQRPQNCGTSYCSCIECVMEPAAQATPEPGLLKTFLAEADRAGITHLPATFGADLAAATPEPVGEVVSSNDLSGVVEWRGARQKAGTSLFTRPAPGVPEGWRDAKNDPPPVGVDVLVAAEFDGPGDWRIKVGGRYPEHRTGWWVFGASWVPQVWMPLDVHRAMLAAAQAKGGV